MADNLFKAPGSDLKDAQQDIPLFYVVSMRKFTIMFLSTIGLYSVYWFYQHWQNYKVNRDLNLWPVPRAIFSVFFTHALFKRFTEEAQVGSNELKRSLMMHATGLVVFSVLVNILDHFIAEENYFARGLAMIFVLVALLVCWYCAGVAQKTANLASGDPRGSGNHELTGLNWLWILIGLMLWLVMLLSTGLLFFTAFST